MRGEIVLGYGRHEIEVKTEWSPSEVYLCIEDPCGGIQVCNGDVNKVGVTTLVNGFVLYADVKSNTCCISWTAK